MLIGGGLDIKVSKHIALRPIGEDYYYTRLPSFITGNDTNKNPFSLLGRCQLSVWC
jgi:hypothetical protein